MRNFVSVLAVACLFSSFVYAAAEEPATPNGGGSGEVVVGNPELPPYSPPVVEVPMFPEPNDPGYPDQRPRPPGSPHFDYRCKFEFCAACSDCKECDDHKKGNVECWVEGSLCPDHHADSTNPENANYECKKEPLKIRCSDGFSLVDEHAADAVDEGTLWVNGQEHGHKMATLHVWDFRKSSP